MQCAGVRNVDYLVFPNRENMSKGCYFHTSICMEIVLMLKIHDFYLKKISI